jgi:hypothetical protein
MPRLFDNLTNKVFGRLYVVRHSPARRGHWVCQCNCGAIRVIRSDSLQQGRTTSCGCYRDECSTGRKGQPKPRKHRRTKPTPLNNDWV